ncbi:uncharacterized protein [Watersipora subatra]|uniref:uncharacterized protein n=1 Tax=Watersipora subatra TaxID=2589382 RepID=UPI00355C610D
MPCLLAGCLAQVEPRVDSGVKPVGSSTIGADKQSVVKAPAGMVLKKSKYGLNTGATLRRPSRGRRFLHNHHSDMYISQVVGETESCSPKEDVKRLSNMLPSYSQLKVRYSLNKQNRWELPTFLKAFIYGSRSRLYEDYDDEKEIILTEERNGRTVYHSNLPQHDDGDEDAPTLPTFAMAVMYGPCLNGKTAKATKKFQKSRRYMKGAILPISDYSLSAKTPVLRQPSVQIERRSDEIDPTVKVDNRSKRFLPVYSPPKRFLADTRNQSKKDKSQSDTSTEKSHIHYIAPPIGDQSLDHSYPISNQPPSTQLSFSEVLIKGSDVEKTALTGCFGKKYREVFCSPRTFILNLSTRLGDEARNAKLKFYLVVTMKDKVEDINWCRVHCTGDFIARESSALSTVMQGVIYDLPTIVDLALAHRTASVNCRKRLRSATCVRGSPTVRHQHVVSFNQSQPLRRLASTLRRYYKRGPENYIVFSYAQCPVCLESITESTRHTAVLPCQHDFCDQCWNRHLDSAVYHGCVHVSCMQYGCNTQLDSAFIMSMVEWSTYRLYETLNAERFLARNQLKSCPNLNCGRVLRCDAELSANDEPITASCKCGTECCFRCLKEPHWPLTCDQLTKYHALLQSDKTVSFTGQMLPSSIKQSHTSEKKNCNWKKLDRGSQSYYLEARRHRRYKQGHVRPRLKKQCSRLLYTSQSKSDHLVFNSDKELPLDVVLKRLASQILVTHNLLEYCCAANIYKESPKYCVPTITLLSFSLDVLEGEIASASPVKQATADKITKYYCIVKSNAVSLVQRMSKLLGLAEPIIPE